MASKQTHATSFFSGAVGTWSDCRVGRTQLCYHRLRLAERNLFVSTIARDSDLCLTCVLSKPSAKVIYAQLQWLAVPKVQYYNPAKPI